MVTHEDGHEVTVNLDDYSVVATPVANGVTPYVVERSRVWSMLNVCVRNVRCSLNLARKTLIDTVGLALGCDRSEAVRVTVAINELIAGELGL